MTFKYQAIMSKNCQTYYPTVVGRMKPRAKRGKAASVKNESPNCALPKNIKKWNVCIDTSLESYAYDCLNKNFIICENFGSKYLSTKNIGCNIKILWNSWTVLEVGLLPCAVVQVPKTAWKEPLKRLGIRFRWAMEISPDVFCTTDINVSGHLSQHFLLLLDGLYLHIGQRGLILVLNFFVCHP